MMKGVIDDVKNKIRLVLQSQQYCDKWMSEDYLFDVLKFNYHYNGKKCTMNRAMGSLKDDSTTYKISINPRYIRKKHTNFYHVSVTGVIPKTSSMSQSDWESIHEYKRITRVATINKSASAIEGNLEPSQCKKPNYSCNPIEDSHHTTVPQFIKNYATTTSSITNAQKLRSNTRSTSTASTFGIITPSPKKNYSKQFTTPNLSVIDVTNLNFNNNDEIFNKYFESTEMRNLFCPSTNESVEDCIIRRISILTEIIENHDGIKKYVEHSKKHPLTTQQVQSLTVMCTALRASYYFALNHMAIEKNWSAVIKKALQRLCECGIKATMNEKTIRRWHQWFRRNETFPHPNHYVQMGKKVMPKLFEAFPKAKNMIKKFASENLQVLSSDALALHVKDEVIPTLHKKHIQECEVNNQVAMDIDEFKHFLNLTHVDPTTCWRWLKLLGYKHLPNKKCYYTDRHEDPANVEARKVFIDKYFNYESQAYVWVHLTAEEATILENDQNINLAKAFHSYTGENGSEMREYHIDIHPHLYSFVRNKRMGGDLSVRNKDGSRPVIIIGQDESIVKQYSFSSKSWQGAEGQRKLVPKSDGYSLMISAFCSRAFGLGLTVTNEQLFEINKRRSEGLFSHYVSTESANEIYGTTLKKPFDSKELLVRYFEVGVMAEGYWNYHHMALQTEDAFDVLAIIYPHCDVIKLTDQSSGHGKAVKDALDATLMNVNYGGKKFMKKTTVTDVGKYFYNDADNPQLKVGDEQILTFEGNHPGPFYLSAESKVLNKFDRASGQKRKIKKTIDEIVTLLESEHGFKANRRYRQAEIHNIASQYGIPIETEVENSTIEGWYNRPKGLLQVLYERGYVDINNLSKYSKNGRKKQMGEDDKILDIYKKYVLSDIMAQCDDFKNQRNSMEELCDTLSSRGEQSITILTSPKYHCEIAGEGIELNWGFLKKGYRNIPLEEKKTKANFLKAVRESKDKVNIDLVRKFAAKTRRYMLTYSNIESEGLTYESIEKFCKKIATHRNMGDSEKGYIEQMWRESMKLCK